MPRIKRKFRGDGREPLARSANTRYMLEGLDRIPTEKLPGWVDTVFFGGGWYMLCHYATYKGYTDGHVVFISPFYISLRPVSIKEWQAVMGEYRCQNQWDKRDESLPAKATWKDAAKYCIKRSNMEGLDPCYKALRPRPICDWNANGYRLPTEAEFNYATPGYKRRLPKRPDPFPRKVKVDRKNIPEYGSSGFNLILAAHKTMLWDFFDHRYFRESPKFDPTGPGDGFFHAYRHFPRLLIPQSWSFKPYRGPVCDHDRCQFYVARSWIFEGNVRENNRIHGIPQWDR